VRVDFACFENGPYIRGEREEIRQLDIRPCLRHWRADSVYEHLAGIQRHPPPGSGYSLVASLVASSLGASVGRAA